MLSTIDIYNAGAEGPVITHDDALDVVRPKIFVPREANMDRHQSCRVTPEYHGTALELGQHTAPRPHRPPRSPRRPRCLDAREKPLGGHIFIGGGAEHARPPLQF
eukprot:scaffold4344_cov114-Isochrysis_galbana.AAC.6